MARLLPWLPLALLLTGSAAAAQQPPLPPHERQERQVVVPNNANEPVPEVRVAAGIATLLVFDTPIDRSSVEVEGRAMRFRLVDPGERTLVLEPLVAPGDGERLAVRLRFKDGASPTYATFALISHPALVDSRMDVVRRQRTPEALEVALAQCEAAGPARLVLSGQLDREGVQATDFQGTIPPGNKSGLAAKKGTGYRATRWALLAIPVSNLPGQKPWAPGSARLFNAEGTPLGVRRISMERPQLQPGEAALVVVETDPPTSGKPPYRLELLDTEGGRLLPIHDVQF
ncbi:DUF2381 family protein [Archangium lansingense]|uniref:DUF2381 family protein n=1 Tax=Archangium lansingense TaxID=2995310 RepID=A0ABT4ALP8_9BACT|nr:DUF2381 family protein [Archangium lansinium]MCY1082621.1 DUF2381 family protein [Archangium lansinium]